MNRQTRSLILLLFGVPALLVVPIVLLGSTLFHAGSIEFEVHEKGGTSIGGSIPASMIPVALHLAPAHVMDEVRCEVRGELGEHLDIVNAALKAISRCPDGVLVDVLSGDEIVRIEKREGRLEIFVDTPSETVRAGVPLHTVASVLSSI